MALSTKATLVLQSPERKASVGGASTISTFCDSEFGSESSSSLSASQVSLQFRDDSLIFNRGSTTRELKLSEIKKIQIRRRKLLFLRQKIKLTTVDGSSMTMTNFDDVQALNAIIKDLEKDRFPESTVQFQIQNQILNFVSVKH